MYLNASLLFLNSSLSFLFLCLSSILKLFFPPQTNDQQKDQEPLALNHLIHLDQTSLCLSVLCVQGQSSPWFQSNPKWWSSSDAEQGIQAELKHLPYPFFRQAFMLLHLEMDKIPHVNFLFHGYTMKCCWICLVWFFKFLPSHLPDVSNWLPFCFFKFNLFLFNSQYILPYVTFLLRHVLHVLKSKRSSSVDRGRIFPQWDSPCPWYTGISSLIAFFVWLLSWGIFGFCFGFGKRQGEQVR